MVTSREKISIENKYLWNCITVFIHAEPRNHAVQLTFAVGFPAAVASDSGSLVLRSYKQCGYFRSTHSFRVTIINQLCFGLDEAQICLTYWPNNLGNLNVT